MGHGHCGLVTYVHNQFNATDITDRITVEHAAWDYMCLKIFHQKPNSKKYLVSRVQYVLFVVESSVQSYS